MQPERRPPLLTNFQWLHVTLTLAAGLFLGLGALVAVGEALRTLAIIFFGFTIAIALAPLINWLSQRIPRIAAILLTYLVLVLIVIAIIAVIVPTLATQAQQLFDQLPGWIEEAQQWIEQRGWITIDELFSTLTSQIQNIGSELVQLPILVFSGLLDIVLIVFVSLFALIEAPRIRKFTQSLIGGPKRRIWDVIQEMLDSVSGYIRGVVFQMIIIGALTTIGLSIIGVPFALVLGITAGLFEALPTIGPVLAFFPVVGVAFLQSPTTGVITAIFILLIQQFESNVLTPLVMRGQTEVSPLLVLIAVFIGGAVGGVVGALVAIPLVAALRVFVLRVVAPWVRNETGADPQQPIPKPNPEGKS